MTGVASHIPQLLLGASGAGAVGGGLLLSAGVALVSFFLMMRLRRRSPRRGPKETPRETVDRVRAQAGSRESLDALMVEVQELTRLCASQIESRAQKLEVLIREADRKIALLQRAGVDLSADTVVEPDAVATMARARGAGGAVRTDPLSRRVYDLADTGMESMEIARELEEHVGKVDLILALRQR